VIYLDFDFRQLVQGASSITEYCHSHKKIADALSENDSAVSDRVLVLNTRRGLGPWFSSAATVISMMDPLPTFLRVRSMLLMEEMQQANAAANTASMALIAQTRPPAPTCTGAGCHGDSSNSGKSRKQKNKTGGKTTGGPARSGNPAPQGPWVCFCPGVGQLHTPYTGPDIRGPRPQAYTTTAAPIFQSTLSSSAAPAWDNAGLIAALNSL
jgi:hypothetical protein